MESLDKRGKKLIGIKRVDVGEEIKSLSLL